MSTARNGDVEIYYEEFGDPDNPTLLLVNGLGSQCLNYAASGASSSATKAFRSCASTTAMSGSPRSSTAPTTRWPTWPHDAIAVLDAIGVDKAHVMGCSMGGMIVQRLAIDHPDRLLSMTSVMSRTGEPGYGESSEEALAVLMAPPAASRSAYIDRQVAAHHVYGSKPEWLDDDAIRAGPPPPTTAASARPGSGDRCEAVGHDGSRSEQLAQLDLPALVIHGSRDTLIDPERRPAHR